MAHQGPPPGPGAPPHFGMVGPPGYGAVPPGMMAPYNIPPPAAFGMPGFNPAGI
jgi:hypothetical protein